jgi:LPS export ABC transporter permease LptF
MRILKSYVLKELILPFFLSFVVFTFILLMGNLFKVVDLVIRKGVDISSILSVLACLIPYVMSFTIPMSLLTGTLLSFGRLSSDNEIMAMKTHGVSLYRVISPVVLIGVLLSLVSLIFNDKVLPVAYTNSKKIVVEIGVRNPTAYLEPGSFIRGFKNYVIFIYKIDKNKLFNVRVYETKITGLNRTIIARRGEFHSDLKNRKLLLKLFDVTTDEPDPNDPTRFYKVKIASQDLILELDEGASSKEKNFKEMTIGELKDKIGELKRHHVDVKPLVTEVQKRFSLSFASLAFVLIALPLAIKTKRQEKSIGFGISAAVILFYYILLAAGEAVSTKGFVHPFIGMWAGNIILTVLGIFLLYKVIEG